MKDMRQYIIGMPTSAECFAWWKTQGRGEGTKHHARQRGARAKHSRGLGTGATRQTRPAGWPNGSSWRGGLRTVAKLRLGSRRRATRCSGSQELLLLAVNTPLTPSGCGETPSLFFSHLPFSTILCTIDRYLWRHGSSRPTKERETVDKFVCVRTW